MLGGDDLVGLWSEEREWGRGEFWNCIDSGYKIRSFSSKINMGGITRCYEQLMQLVRWTRKIRQHFCLVCFHELCAQTFHGMISVANSCSRCAVKGEVMWMMHGECTVES